MKRTISIAAACAVIVLSLYVLSVELSPSIGVPEPILPTAEASPSKPRKTMRPFASEEEFRTYLKRVSTATRRRSSSSNSAVFSTAVPQAASPEAKESSAAAPTKATDSITNNQHAGVDEGGIVKRHGDFLVILRRGRLFTVRIGGDSFAPIDHIDAFAPGVEPSRDWYDEMLISGDTIAVIGYSYGRGGTEVNLFDISSAGDLKYRSTYHLRSNDYYSSRNYASRLIGDKLVFYSPFYLGYGSDDPDRFLPAVRRWHQGARPDEFQRIIPATAIYRPEGNGPVGGLALHTVTVCDLAAREFSCKATATLGSSGRVFYVSPTSVYVWTSERFRDAAANGPAVDSMLFRLPLDGGAPSALGVNGSPMDQFSFLETDSGELNVLIRPDGGSEGMWGSERTEGRRLALFRTAISEFNDGSRSATEDAYKKVPASLGRTMQNRFVGDDLLYGGGNSWGRPDEPSRGELVVVDLGSGEATKVSLEHGVDRIEQMGSDAVIVGANSQDLFFTPVTLGAKPAAQTPYVRRNASQGELRSHGFFYKPSSDDSGMLGLPIARAGRAGWRHLKEDSAAVLFLRNSRSRLSELGELASDGGTPSDNCRASCVDWYGNARPLFIGDRVFALLGYEIVEGRVGGSRITEHRRMNYSPGRNADRWTPGEE